MSHGVTNQSAGAHICWKSQPRHLALWKDGDDAKRKWYRSASVDGKRRIRECAFDRSTRVVSHSENG